MKGAPNPRRAELRALSMQIRPMVKAGMLRNVNEGLVAHWREQTGQSEFRTFQDWRKLGRPVKKGEQGFPIWATPRHLKPAEGAQMGGDLGQLAALNGIEPQGPQWFPVAYLFHAGQVEAQREELAA